MLTKEERAIYEMLKKKADVGAENKKEVAATHNSITQYFINRSLKKYKARIEAVQQKIPGWYPTFEGI